MKGENEMLFSFSMGLLAAVVTDLLLGGKEVAVNGAVAIITYLVLMRTGWGVRAEKWLDSLENDKRNLVPLTIFAFAIIAGVLTLAFFTR